MPHSIEAEQSVVGAMLMDKDAITTAGEIISGDDFYQASYGVIFDSMIELFNEGKPVDLITLQERLKEKDVPAEIASLEFVRDLVTAVPTSATLVSNPEVVILDEPNTYIDKRFEAKLYSLLEEINKERAIILVSHDIGTVLQNVKTIACVNETLDYHPDTEVPTEWLEEHFGCPIELLGHGNFPHRILKCHHHDE